MDELPIEIPSDPPEKEQPTRRGWWDYVAEPAGTQPTPVKAPNGKDGMLKDMFSKTLGARKQKVKLSKKKSKLLAKGSSEKDKATDPLENGNLNRSRHSLAPSYMSRFSKLMPRMELFQSVMKDEVRPQYFHGRMPPNTRFTKLLYTTFFTSTCVVVAVLAIIGVNFKNGLSVTGWIALNCKVVRNVSGNTLTFYFTRGYNLCPSCS